MQLHDRRDEEKVLVLGHRGFHKTEKENTLAAFGKAIEAGCDGIELDDHMTADGQLVVHHDFSLKRVWEAPLTVEEATLDEIRDVSGSIPTLSEVLDSMGPIYYDIEIKAGFRYSKKLIYSLLEELEKRPELRERTMISSFNPLAMHEVQKAMDYEYPLLIIYDGTDAVPKLLRHGKGRLFFRASGLKPKWDIAEEEKKRLHRYPVVPWTVDEVQTLISMIRLKAPIVITNESEAIIRALQEESLH